MIAKPFTNELGQVIQPGEKVLAVTKTWGSPHTSVVEYLGVSETQADIIQKVKIRRPTHRGFWFDVVTGERCGWRASGVKYDYEDTFIVTTLEHNRIYKLEGIS